METGKLFTYLIYIIISIFVLIVLISLAAKFSSHEECTDAINATQMQIFGNIRKCVQLCWSKHRAGSDIYVDDCFLVQVSSKTNITASALKSWFNDIPVNAYFDILESGNNYTLKIRYNSTVPEISIFNINAK